MKYTKEKLLETLDAMKTTVDGSIHKANSQEEIKVMLTDSARLDAIRSIIQEYDKITEQLEECEKFKDMIGMMPLCAYCDGKTDGVRNEKCDYEGSFMRCARQAKHIVDELEELRRYKTSDYRGLPQMLKMVQSANGLNVRAAEAIEYLSAQLTELRTVRDAKVDELETELRKYREDEENGLIVRLPCKVGANAYVINNDGCKHYGFCEKECHGFDNTCNSYTASANYISQLKFRVSDMPSVGKSLFLTREEAEAALKEGAIV